MKEIRDILKAFAQAEKEGKKTALATVVQVEGSSYRRPGARMLITEDGMLTGAISGGCLEGDALRKALAAIAQKRNKLVTYDSTDEDDAKFGIQLGCNGIVHILFEPIQSGKPGHPLELLQELIDKREDAVLATLFSRDHIWQPGTCLLYRNATAECALPLEVHAQVMEEAQQVLQSGQSRLSALTDNLQVFTEFIAPPVSLIIAGAGNDIKPLVDIATVLGWHITVVDGRATHATVQRFPNADRVLVVKSSEVLSQLTIDRQTALVLMTHNYNYDFALLAQVISLEYGYFGMLGPRRKLERMLDELESGGVQVSDEQRESIHGPVGLDIGAETAEEIAVSIIAEIKAVLSGRTAISLKEKKYPIHSDLEPTLSDE